MARTSSSNTKPNVTGFFPGHNNGRATDMKASTVADVVKEFEVNAASGNYTYSVNSEQATINTKLHEGDVVSISKSKNKSGS